jgi:hypothetical protein
MALIQEEIPFRARAYPVNKKRLIAGIIVAIVIMATAWIGTSNLVL